MDTACLEFDMPRQWHPLSSGPISVWRLRPFSLTDLQSRQRVALGSKVHINAQGVNRVNMRGASSRGSECKFTPGSENEWLELWAHIPARVSGLKIGCKYLGAFATVSVGSLFCPLRTSSVFYN